jgi:hypothetical protein
VRVIKGIVLVGLVALLVIVLGVVGLLAMVTARALPQESGTVPVPGLGGSVTVARDSAGIAHITADSPHDLFFAQGYVHASERMWQMEVWRHISAGRLSELFGESQLDTDRFIRALGWRIAAQRDLDAYSPATVAVLDAYTAGVNAWLDGIAARWVWRSWLAATRRSRGPTSTRSRGARSRPGTSAPTSTARCSATWPTRGSATRPGPTSYSRPTATGRG